MLKAMKILSTYLISKNTRLDPFYIRRDAL